MTTVNYKIPNISCAHCVHTIKMEVGDLEGVQSVEGETDAQEVTIVFGDPTTESQILDLLNEIYYPPNTNQPLINL